MNKFSPRITHMMYCVLCQSECNLFVWRSGANSSHTHKCIYLILNFTQQMETSSLTIKTRTQVTPTIMIINVRPVIYSITHDSVGSRHSRLKPPVSFSPPRVRPRIHWDDRTYRMRTLLKFRHDGGRRLPFEIPNRYTGV